MSYPLQDLLKIRQLRERMAQENLIKAQKDLENAFQRVIRKQKALDEFKEWRVDEEDRLYYKIHNKKIKTDGLENFRYEFAQLDEKELVHEKAVIDAEEKREEAKEALALAREHYKQAIINLEKIREHEKSWLDVWNKELEAAADKEMEEFQSRTMEQV